MLSIFIHQRKYSNHTVCLRLIEGVYGKRPQVTSDWRQNSRSKLLFTSLYRRGEFDIRSRAT